MSQLRGLATLQLTGSVQLQTEEVRATYCQPLSAAQSSAGMLASATARRSAVKLSARLAAMIRSALRSGGSGKLT